MSKLPIVAIVGRANVGKSSIFNRVLDRREAIVANKPGTTRDAIYGKVSVGANAFWLVDTAGLKIAEDDFELTIQEQIIQATESADMIAVVVERGVPITEEDRRVAKMALRSKKPCVLIINKADTPKDDDKEAFMRLGITDKFVTSANHNHGFTELLKHIVETVPPRKDKQNTDYMTMSFVGRPNVGKSSLFNRLLHKQQAVVADVAGTTRDVNRHEITYHNKTIQLLDTAGIRRSGKIGRGIEHFSVLRALAAIEESDVCCLVMDANELNTKLDQKIAGMIKEAGKGLIVVVSKWDSVEDKDAFTRDAIAHTIAREFPFIAWAPLVFTSSVTGKNVTKLFDIAFDIKAKRDIKIPTKGLNRWLKNAIRHHPPAGLKGSHPKLKYMVQDGTNPPSFRIFGNDVRLVHWSYKRFLEKELRAEYDYGGTPIEIYFINNAGRAARKQIEEEPNGIEG